MSLPTNLPSVAKAKLPDTYSAAKNAIAECARIDECKEWADKAAAMASYAKQAQDKSLEDMATKIRARAIRRCGELLKAIDPGKGTAGRKGIARSAPDPQSRSAAARDAGLSERQAKTALRVASVPDDEFEAAVESDSPPTITDLAERGKQPAPERKPFIDLDGRSPDDFRAATEGLAVLDQLLRVVRSIPAAAVARGERKERRNEVATKANEAIAWLKQLSKECSR